jgi:hypothetical protein
LLNRKSADHARPEVCSLFSEGTRGKRKEKKEREETKEVPTLFHKRKKAAYSFISTSGK